MVLYIGAIETVLLLVVVVVVLLLFLMEAYFVFIMSEKAILSWEKLTKIICLLRERPCWAVAGALMNRMPALFLGDS